ncbi:MAG: M15 family metallopeptidase [bacterium]
MQLLKIGSSGNEVKNWQLFLIGQNLLNDIADGKFGQKTFDATVLFQKLNSMEPDGKVGNKTVGAAMLLGFPVLKEEDEGKSGQNWPPRPKFSPLASNEERQKVFGKFRFRAIGDGNIEILDNWERDNIVMINIPQLTKVKGGPNVRFHKLGANQLKKLWSDWEKANLLHLVLTWEGSFVPRFVRGSNSVLSNHAFGSAFDINFQWNQLRTTPALVGRKGSVRELVPIAHENGFYWGGHFTRLDGMHFEVAKLQ